MGLILTLLQQMSVFLVIAYLFSKSPVFRPVAGKEPRVRRTVLIYLIFSTFSILGTYFGLEVQGAIANTRAIGAVLAGLIGGPKMGLAVGLTSGLHRYSLGGFTAFSCGVSTTVEGLLGGLVHAYLNRSNKGELAFAPSVAFLSTFVAETLQMLIILMLARPFDEAVSLVKVIALPMMLANSMGAALFVSMMRDQISMYQEVGAIFSAKAVKVAERTLGVLIKGFNAQSAHKLASIIHEETGVAAVSITDRNQVMAFVGKGEDHHMSGHPIANELVRTAMDENRTIYLDGFERQYICPLTDDCPLGSALIAPLRIDREVIGAIILCEAKNKLLHRLTRTLGEGIANLLSDQLLRIHYLEQRNLLMESELKLIQAQVNPHFLFNALNTISAIIRKDADRARGLLQDLSSLFRKNLKRSGELATFQDELSHVNAYLKIEKARFEDRLQVEQTIDPSVLNAKIPTFTLQPLVENAIKHGISNMISGGRIHILACQDADRMLIQVEDNAGLYNPDPQQEGLGVRIVNTRIRNLCGSDYGITVDSVLNERTIFRITLPVGGCTS